MLSEIIKEKAVAYIDGSEAYDLERKQRLKMLVEKLLSEEKQTTAGEMYWEEESK